MAVDVGLDRNRVLDEWAQQYGVRWTDGARQTVADELEAILLEHGVIPAPEEFQKAVTMGWIERAGLVQLTPVGPGERPHDLAYAVKCATCERLIHPVLDGYDTVRGLLCPQCVRYIRSCVACGADYDERQEGTRWLCETCAEKAKWDGRLQRLVRSYSEE